MCGNVDLEPRVALILSCTSYGSLALSFGGRCAGFQKALGFAKRCYGYVVDSMFSS